MQKRNVILGSVLGQFPTTTFQIDRQIVIGTWLITFFTSDKLE